MLWFDIYEVIACQSLISSISSNCKSHPNTLLACNDTRFAQYPLILQKALKAEKKFEEMRKKNAQKLNQDRQMFEECMEKGGSITTCKIELNLTVSRYSTLTGNSSASNSTYP